ncbi:MAG: Ig-like domain-containing protein, partial [Pseudomonadota bacterium]
AVSSATVTHLEVAPYDAVIADGHRLQFRAFAHFTDGSHRDVTGEAEWSSSNSEIAVVYNVEDYYGIAEGVDVGQVSVSALYTDANGNSESGSAPLEVKNAVLSSIEVAPYDFTIPDGHRVKLTAIGYFSNGTVADLTEQVGWGSSDGEVVVVSNVAGQRGLAEAVDLGTGIVISATFVRRSDGVAIAGSATISVTEATLDLLEVAPRDAKVADGHRLQFRAFAHFSNHTVQDVTPFVTWSSSDTAKATISNVEGEHGQATGVATGTDVVITAALGDATGTATLDVTAATLESIFVEPFEPEIAAGTGLQFHAVGEYSDGMLLDLTAMVSWLALDGEGNPVTTVTIGNTEVDKGWARGHAAGTAYVYAFVDDEHFGLTTITVGVPAIDFLEVAPNNVHVGGGSKVPFNAFLHFTDGSFHDVTPDVAWASSNASVAVASNAEGQKGVVSTFAVGSATEVTIAAIFVDQDGTAHSSSEILTVTPATIEFLEVVPAQLRIALGTGVFLHAHLHFSDGFVQEVTPFVRWYVDATDTLLCWVSNDPGETGRVGTHDDGSCTVKADYVDPAGQLTTGSTEVIIVEETIASVGVAFVDTTIAGNTVAVDTSTPLRATATFSTFSQDVTPWALWASSAPGVAMVSNHLGDKGMLSALGAGSANVTATFGGVANSTFTVTASSATMEAGGIVVSALETTVPIYYWQHLRAIGTFADGTVMDVTPMCDWTVQEGDRGVVEVSNWPEHKGWALAQSDGDAVVYCHFGGQSGSVTLVVDQDLLLATNGISITPSSATIDAGDTLALAASGEFSDGAATYDVDLTKQVEWYSSSPAVCLASNHPGEHGLVTGLGAGACTIVAYDPQSTQSATVTVTVQ